MSMIQSMYFLLAGVSRWSSCEEARGNTHTARESSRLHSSADTGLHWTKGDSYKYIYSSYQVFSSNLGRHVVAENASYVVGDFSKHLDLVFKGDVVHWLVIHYYSHMLGMSFNWEWLPCLWTSWFREVAGWSQLLNFVPWLGQLPHKLSCAVT